MGHDFLYHELKTEYLQCDACHYQDIVVDDFIEHVRRKHNRRLSTGDAMRHLERNRQSFVRLSYCFMCGIRHRSDIWIRAHHVFSLKLFFDIFGFSYDCTTGCVYVATDSVRADNVNDSGGNTRTE